MYTGNTMQLSGALQSAELLLDNAPDGQHDGYKLNISMTVTITGTPTPATADLKNFLSRAIGQLYEEYGPKSARRMGLNAVDGLDLRTLHRYCERNEIPNNFVGVVQAAGDTTFTATLTRPFLVKWLRGMRKRLGVTQLRTFKLKAFEGASTIWGSGTYIRKAGTFITLEVEYMNRPGKDRIAPVLTLSRENSPRKDLTGPDGVTIIAWVPAVAAASSALTAFTLDIGKTRIHQLQSVQSVTRAFADDQVDQGAAGITDEVTPIYFAGDNDEVEALPHGPIKIEEAKSDLSPIDLRVLHYPVMSELEVKGYASHAAAKYGRPVLLTQSEPDNGAGHDNGAAAVAPVEILTPDDARFALVPGILGAPGSAAAAVSIPPHYVANAAQARRSAGAAAVGTEAVRRLEKITSLRVPGATGTDGGGQGSIREEVRARFSAA